MNPHADWQPATVAERYRIIDIIRGLALFGVLLVNILSDFRVPLLEHVLRPFSPAPADRLVDLLAVFALEFKALTIFSFLFGVGIAIQIERAAVRHVRAREFLLRRLSWLFVFGVIHLFVIWNGDILTLYAVCGWLLVPFLNLPWPALLAIGAALIGIQEFVPFGMPFPSGPAAEAAIVQTRQVYGHAGFLAILEFRWRESWSLIVPVLMHVLPRTAGLMFCGVGAWRSGILRDARRHRRKLFFVFVIGASVGGAITLDDVWAGASGKVLWPALRHTHLDPSILLASAYVSAFLLWLNHQRVTFLRGIAAMGRMALTNYLIQSIVLGFIFYGYGFGLFGRIGSAAAAAIGLSFYIVQVLLSRLWLDRLYFGPFEWLWRSATYGRQPMLREHRVAAETGVGYGG